MLSLRWCCHFLYMNYVWESRIKIRGICYKVEAVQFLSWGMKQRWLISLLGQVFSLSRQACWRRSRTQQEALQVRKYLYMQPGRGKGNLDESQPEWLSIYLGRHLKAGMECSVDSLAHACWVLCQGGIELTDSIIKAHYFCYFLFCYKYFSFLFSTYLNPDNF